MSSERSLRVMVLQMRCPVYRNLGIDGASIMHDIEVDGYRLRSAGRVAVLVAQSSCAPSCWLLSNPGATEVCLASESAVDSYIDCINYCENSKKESILSSCYHTNDVDRLNTYLYAGSFLERLYQLASSASFPA